MQQIIFKRIYLDQIRAGTKTQTVRCWRRKRTFCPGEVVVATDFHQKIKIKIVSIQHKECTKITQNEAKLDGFNNLRDFQRAVIDIYKTLKFEAYIIRFEIV